MGARGRQGMAAPAIGAPDERDGPREVARHRLTTPERPSILDEHYPPRPAGVLERKPRARTAEEREFLAIGEGAEPWLRRTAAEGTRGSVSRWQKRSTSPNSAAPSRSPKRCNDPRPMAGSPTATWPGPRPPTAGDSDRVAQPSPGGRLAAGLDPQLGGIRAMNTPKIDAFAPDRRSESPSEGRHGLAASGFPFHQRPRSNAPGAAMTPKPPAPPPLPDELDRLLRGPAALCSPRGAGGDRYRQKPALGARRGSPGAARRRGRRP